jgi:uncharacterized protein (DUF2147 family)
MKREIITASSMLMALGLAAVPVAAQELSGTFQRDNGESRVRFQPCGQAVCGSIVWLKNPANSTAKVGQRVFYDMVPNGAGSWAGKAFNPEDGKTYSGKITLSGNALTTAGCVAGGLICRSVNWARVN